MSIRTEAIRALKKEIYWHKRQINIQVDGYMMTKEEIEQNELIQKNKHAIEVLEYTLKCVKEHAVLERKQCNEI